MNDAAITPNEDLANRELIDSLVPMAIKRNPRLRPKVAKPRRTPLGQSGWQREEKPKKPKPRMVEVHDIAEPEELEEEPPQFFYEEPIQEEEEEEYDLAPGKNKEMYIEKRTIKIRDEYNPRKIIQYTETHYGADYVEEDIIDSDPDSEVEGIDYPDGECICSYSEDDGFDDY
jgi:hypothetical protein